MTDQFKEFINLLKKLAEYDVDYILIGGVAVIMHGMERLTRDIDLFIRNTPSNIEKLKDALHSLYQDPSIEEITFNELQKYPVMRYGTPNGFYIDIMTRLGESVSFEDLQYEMIEYQGTKIKIATPKSLYELKKDTVRERDKMDALFLRGLIFRSD